MTKAWVLLALVACGGGAVHPPREAKAPDTIAITHVTVVPMTSEQELADQTVIVDGTKISAVGPAATTAVPAGALVIDGRGAWLVPGLFDMHTHATSADDRTRYLANGVTSVRVMWGMPETQALQKRIARREAKGPWIYSAGPIMDGDPPVWPGSLVLHTPEEAIAAVDEQKHQGYEMLKVYDRLPADAYVAIATEAKKNGQRVVGHVPESVGLAKALELGQASIEHLEGYGHFIARDQTAAARPVFSPQVDLPAWIGFLGDIDPARLAEAVRLTKAAGTWNVPTLVVLDRFANLDRDAARELPGVSTVAPAEVEGWTHGFAATMAPAGFEQMRKALPGAETVVRALHEGGAHILAGTDALNPFVVAGYSLHEELGRLHAAGLSNFETLRAATSDPAVFLKVENEVGTIAPGLRADLVLVDGDPLADLGALAHRRGVVANGRWIAQPELDQQIADITAINHGSRSRFADVPPLPIDGTRLFKARYEHRSGNGPGGAEERVVIDRDARGHVIVTSEMRGGFQDQTVRVVIDGAGTSMTVTDESSRLELVRDGGTVQATFTLISAEAVKIKVPLAADTLFSDSTLAPDHIFYARLAALAVGGKGEWKLAAPGEGRFIESTLSAQRTPDAARKVAGKQVTVKNFEVTFTDDSRSHKGTIVLDPDGHLVEMTLDVDHIVRIE